MVDRINNNSVSTLMRCQIPVAAPEEVREAEEDVHENQNYTTNRGSEDPMADPNQQAAAGQDTRAQHPQRPIVKDKMPGRNDPCPCGSGKKFKNCHGKGIV